MSSQLGPVAVFTKDPDAHLDYQLDWSRWLIGDDDTISGSQWLIEDIDGGTCAMLIDTAPSFLPSFTSTTATCWLLSGTSGHRYRLTNRITTAAGRIDDRSVTVNCSGR